MTFTELRTEILDRLNLSSTDATTRVGRAINRTYRKITTSIGLQLSRRTTTSKAVTVGVSTVVFSNTEKVINVVNRSTTPYRTLEEKTLDELEAEMPFTANDSPTKWAPHSHTSDTVTILINRIPQTGFTLYADVHQAVADLSGSNEPAFPESFHDIIIEGVLSDELRKMEKPALAKIAKDEYERILSDLRMWIAKSVALDIYQGKTESAQTGGGGTSGSSGSSINGALSYTQTGLITFDRDPSAPFAVTLNSAVVTNLNADMMDGLHASDFIGLADNVTVSGIWNFDGQVDFDAQVDMSQGSLLLPQIDVPVQTTEGSVFWDTDNDLLTVGTGGGRKVMVDTDSSQTLANKIITLTTPQINDTSADHQYIFAPSELAADRTVTLPLLTGADEFVFKDHSVTLTNKTLTSPIINTTLQSSSMFSGFCQGRLTLTTNTPVTTADVTGATTIYFSPYGGNLLSLYDGSSLWKVYPFTELSLALGTLTSSIPYDVFVYDNSGTPTLEFTAWTNDTTRATALTKQNGVYVKTGATTRRYLGTFRTTSTTQTEDSFAKRFVWNYYNRITRVMRVIDTTDSWSYTLNAFQQANASSANQLDFVIGVAEDSVEAAVIAASTNTNASVARTSGIGLDSTTTKATGSVAGTANGAAGDVVMTSAQLNTFPTEGRHFLAWLERSAATGATTWRGDNGGAFEQAGISGWLRA